MKNKNEAIMASDQSDRTDRFEAKRELIISAAAELINERGVKGMTFVDVGRMVDLNTTSIAYYFKRKEKLAEAAFHELCNQALRKLIDKKAKSKSKSAVIEDVDEPGGGDGSNVIDLMAALKQSVNEDKPKKSARRKKSA